MSCCHNVYRRGDKFVVLKKLDGRVCSFGTYDCLEDAVRVRDYYDCNGWVYERKYRVRSDELRYIYLLNGKWCIMKGGVYFGSYSCLDDAKEDRDLLVGCGFDVDEFYSLV